MTKAEIIKKVASETGMLRKDTSIVIDTFIDCIIEALKDDDSIELRGFGTFSMQSREPRIGRNPKTGEQISIPGRIVPTFKYNRRIKDELTKPKDEKK